MPPKNSPFWPILRLLVVSTMGIIGVSVGYQEGWVTRSDLPIVAAIALSLLGVDSLQYLSKR